LFVNAVSNQLFSFLKRDEFQKLNELEICEKIWKSIENDYCFNFKEADIDADRWRPGYTFEIGSTGYKVDIRKLFIENDSYDYNMEISNGEFAKNLTTIHLSEIKEIRINSFCHRIYTKCILNSNEI